MKRNLLLIITLLCAVAQGSWGQTLVKNENELAQAVKTNYANIVMSNDIELSKPITIQGDGSAPVTVSISMNGKKLSYKQAVGQSAASCVFIVPAGSVMNLNNGSIENVNNTSGNNTYYVAGAIVNDGTVSLNTVTISGCKGLLGGAIKNNENATLNLTSCSFQSNEAAKKENLVSAKGGAIWNNGTISMIDIEFKDCQAEYGGVIYNGASGVITMSTDNKNTSFYSNKASADGAAIYNLGSVSLASPTTFNTNIATNNAGAIWNNGPLLSLKGCDFMNNHGKDGAAIYNAENSKIGDEQKVTISGGSFSTNISQNNGGAIFTAGNASAVSVSNTSFSGNKATTSGGAVYCQSAMTFNHISFKENQVTNVNGGAIYITQSGSLTIKDDDNNGNEFSENVSSANGGAIYTSGVLSMKGVTATSNIANLGGFLYIDESGNATVDNNTSLSENTANTNGGAIYNNGKLYVNGKVSIKNNTCAEAVASNVYLAKDKIINVNGGLNSSMICVGLEDNEGVFTSGFSSHNGDTDPATIFAPDYYPEFYGVTLADKEAKIALQSPIVIGDEATLRKALSMFDNFSIKLSADINITNSTLEIPANKTVTIDLGGFTLDRGLKAREWNTGGQVITVRKDATLNLSNGTLTGGWGGNGGGIANEGGTANLTNVNITGCIGDDRGGGISNKGTLTMTGGSITNNSSNDAEEPKGGGGFFNYEGATATLSGVTISGNEAKVKGGGGICNYGTMTLDGCTITGNTSKIHGGGIWTAASATLNMQGTITVTGNTASGVTNNIFLKTDAVITATGALTGSQIGVNLENEIGTFTSGYKKNNDGVDPATIFKADKDNFFDVALSGDEASLIVQGTVIVDNFADLREAVKFDKANIQLAADINSSDILAIENNKTVTIDLGGFTLNRGLTSLYNGHGQVVVVAAGSTLNLSNGTLTGGYGGDGGGLENKGTATLTNVTITGNHANDRGGGISNHGTLTMTGGSITNNTSNDDDYQSSIGGGGIFTYAGSTTTLSGVTITGNQAKIVGGGGINNFGTLTLDGCTITGNTAKDNGGGIWNGGGSKLNMQGKNTVTDNTGKGNAKNVFLTNGIVITVTGSLEGSQIGLSMQTPDVFTSGFSANNDKAPLTYFLSDDSGYKIVASDNEAKLVKDMETGIETVSDVRGQMSDVWYDLNGRRLEMKPATKGVYINNGHKVVIK